MKPVALLGLALATGPHAPETKMIAPQEVVAVDEGLTVTLKDRRVKLLGIRPRDGRAARDALERILKTAVELRTVEDEGTPGGEALYVEYVAMVDRSGPIWLDAGHVLVGQKSAVVDKGVTFSRRAAYEATQAKADRNTGPRYPND